MFDNEEIPEKISLDELYEGKQKRDLRILSTFKLVLARVHKQIKLTSRQKIDQQYCWFTIPEFMIGVPSYNHKDCAVYIVSKLQENGFLVKYTHPNLLLISWQHWVPSYVRQELKKKTGMEIDGTGNFIKKPNDNYTNLNLNSDGTRDIPMNIMNNFNNNNNNNDNNHNDNNNKINSPDNNYKNINSYNPTGSLVYKEQLLQDLHNKLN